MRFRVLSLLLAVLACPSAAAAQDAVGTGLQKVSDGAAHVTSPDRYAAGVDAFEGSDLHRTLLFQHRLAGDVGMVNAPWIGTHNSFNSNAEMGPALSAKDSNQQLTIVDQLRLGVRSLELDVHWWLGRPTVCHAMGNHEGCTTERSLSSVLEPIAAWLRDHPGEVVLLYLENHLDDEAGHAAGAAAVRESLGDLLYAPPAGSCTELPGTLTRDDIAAAGAQAVIVSDCGPGTAWRSIAFQWEEHRESGGSGEGCVFSASDYDTRLIRFFEDSTFVSSVAGGPTTDHRYRMLTPRRVHELQRCGADLYGFDQATPTDERFEALRWSWEPGQPTAGDCAVYRGSTTVNAKWATDTCPAPLPAACRTSDGAWTVTPPVAATAAATVCAARGATYAAPRTARENHLLGEVAGTRTVRLALQRRSDDWAPLDPR